MNLLLLFICINVFLPLMTVEGLPFYNPDSCYYHTDSAPNSDPATHMAGGFTSETLRDEMQMPTNGTDPLLNPFDPITEPFEQLYQALDTAKEYIVGGYVGKMIDHVAINCELDPTTGQSVIGYVDNDPSSSSYNVLITKYYDDGNGAWADNTCGESTAQTPCYQQNEVLTHFKTGVDVIMAFLIIFLIFYWITGKGHLISS